MSRGTGATDSSFLTDGTSLISSAIANELGFRMKVENKRVVLIDYTLRDDAGEVIDTNQGEAPLPYLHGFGNLIPGLEEVLCGREAGEHLSVTIAPEDGYGHRNEDLRMQFPKEQFESEHELQVGMQFEAETEDGVETVQITEIDGDLITIDANHPLAGVTLNFDVSIREVRDATEEELAHGHVHGPDCNHEE